MDLLYMSLKREIVELYEHWKGKSETYRDLWKGVHLTLHERYYDSWYGLFEDDVGKYRKIYLDYLQS